jgi:hypothetical protein
MDFVVENGFEVSRTTAGPVGLPPALPPALPDGHGGNPIETAVRWFWHELTKRV